MACGDPVVYQEHKELWGLTGEVPPAHRVELGRANVVREGNDLTLVTWSRMVQVACEAAERAAGLGISLEVVDLRTLWPWDREAVLGSAARTGRLLVVHESVQVAGFGAEIAATAAEALGIPVMRLGAPRIPVGYARPLEEESRLDAGKVLAAAKVLLEGRGRGAAAQTAN
jgi:pyruvate/2-oxoglutarate/acetoin dehydrogenase E1 component